MYTAIILILIVLAAWLLVSGVKRKNKGRIAGALIVGLFSFLFFWFMSFWGELLWFRNIGFPERFWLFRLTKYGFVVGGFIIGALVVYLITFSLKGVKGRIRLGATFIGALAGAFWGSVNWELYLKFINRVDAGVADPFFDKDVGFYMFTLPFLDSIYLLLMLLFVISFIAAVIGSFRFEKYGQNIRIYSPDGNTNKKSGGYGSLYLAAGLFLLSMAFLKYLDRFHLMYSRYGVVSGPGWTDMNVRLPALNIIIVITILAAIAVFIPAVRNRAGRYSGIFRKKVQSPRLANLSLIYAATFILWFIGLTVIPGLFQWLKVEPNELRLEEPYIEHNINYTRKAFALDKVEEYEFPAEEVFTEEMFRENQNIFNNVRLWDYRALDAVYKQFQEIRLYYEFADVDVDRYHINGSYRQVMVSAREMEQRNLPQQSQTFVNQRFKYTHGFGITLTNVSEFTENGLPNLLIRDIPPKSKYKSLEVEQPRIYYGELTRQHVIANSSEEEFDYPRGEENEYIHYNGDGGVPISNFWRKFIYGWMFDGTRLVFSGYPREESRIMFHREIRERVNQIAPFLDYDDDPYIALINGQLYWIIDAYTTSTYYPYAEPFSADAGIRNSVVQNGITSAGAGWRLHGKNYVRNSVKAFVNAYSGKVDLYIFDENDPIIQVWNKILPNVFKKKEELPDEFMQHVRYPADYLLAQGLVYAKYHMTDPVVFYNQEDLWIRATEKYYGRTQAVEPYYVMWEPIESDQQEFILMLPFTPKNRQVAIGWIAGMCDMENYGRFLAYKFPKDKRVLGPQQVETKIDQDSHLSGQLTLWDQRGSNVIRGNVLAIPVDNTILYVEPIYLKAETAAYPELRLVAVMHNDELSYAETFEQAIRGLFMEGTTTGTEGMAAETGEGTEELPATMEELIEQANNAFNDYIEATGNRNYRQASRSLEELERALQRLSGEDSW